jgi:hypothetical protein
MVDRFLMAHSLCLFDETQKMVDRFLMAHSLSILTRNNKKEKLELPQIDQTG